MLLFIKGVIRIILLNLIEKAHLAVSKFACAASDLKIIS